MMYLPGNKDVIEPPHKCRCLKCNRPLPTGIAHFVIDSEGKEAPVGPRCFEELTGQRASKALNLALGASREEGDSPQKRETSNKFNDASQTAFERRRRAAEENVLLRAKKLPERGFTNIDKGLFIEFLPRVKNLSEEDVLKIEHHVATIIDKDPCKKLSNLTRCKTVYGQLQRLLLDWDQRKMADEHILNMQDQLCKYNGLIDDQMKKVKTWSATAEKFQIANSVEGIEFKENQARYDKWRKAKYSQGPLR